MPLRDRNQLLLAAGYAPAYGQRGLDEPGDGPGARRRSSGCSPATSRTRRSWSTATGAWSPPTAAVGLLLDGVAAAPARAAGQRPAASSLHPEGVAPRIANLARVARAPARPPRPRGRRERRPGARGAPRRARRLPGGEARRRRPTSPRGAIAVPLRLAPRGRRAVVPQHGDDVRDGGRRHASPSSRSSRSSPPTSAPRASSATRSPARRPSRRHRRARRRRPRSRPRGRPSGRPTRFTTASTFVMPARRPAKPSIRS